MTTRAKLGTAAARDLVAKLAEQLPLLVEVRFPGCGTSSDWYVCSTDEQWEELLARFPSDRILVVKSVRDLNQDGWDVLET